MSPQQVLGHVGALHARIDDLTHQLDWLKRQVFGTKSERRLVDTSGQMSLGEVFEAPAAQHAAEPLRPVAAHTRRAAPQAPDEGAEPLPFFDAARTPVEVIELPNPEVAALAPDQYVVIGHKESFRLAQRPASFVVLKYVRPVVKLRATGAVSCPPAPTGVIAGSRADVSFVAGTMVAKFVYHLPLYRVYEQLIAAGFKLSRPWLTQLMQQGIALLEPIYAAQFESIRAGRVIAMDETPIKAGQNGAGHMKQGYFWPVYGEAHEVCFPFFDNRRAECVKQALGVRAQPGAVLLSDGYSAYSAYAQQMGVTHAQCWAHTRRGFFEARDTDPAAVDQALDQIGALYAVEEAIRCKKLSGDAKRQYRIDHAKPKVEAFFDWIDRQIERLGLLPKNPFMKALAYARERRAGLQVFLADPEVPIDTNHLERALRRIPMGRKAWMFCWTELGARQVGIVQSLITTCRLHDIDPYDYLVDVLQRVAIHPAARVAELTPRLWKQHFAANPLRSDLYQVGRSAQDAG